MSAALPDAVRTPPARAWLRGLGALLLLPAVAVWIALGAYDSPWDKSLRPLLEPLVHIMGPCAVMGLLLLRGRFEPWYVFVSFLVGILGAMIFLGLLLHGG
jgi:hypothetical protein